MSILDDAIREHLELKRAHGADESEIKKLEDEAFGPPQRPDEIDPLAEAPTEFLTAPSEVVEEAAEAVEAEGRREPNITDLQEAPEERAAEAEEAEPAAEAPAEPAVEEQPAGELELPEEPTAEAIADQPTQMFDVQAEIDAEAEAESKAEEPADFDDDDFFSEQRLSDELNAALEAPVTDEEPLPPAPAPPAPEPPSEEGTAIYDVESAAAEKADGEDEESDPHSAYEPDTESHDDVLEDTPDFLEDTPEDDDLWFEQRPPKDFDFDD